MSVFCAYFSIYFLVPNYILKGRYKQMLLVLVILSVGMVTLSYFVGTIVNIRLAWDIPLERTTFVRQLDFTVNNALVNPLMVATFAIGIKMSKNFYLQQKQNEFLAKQKIEAEVKLLKSHVHPTFLFHSLNSIYNSMRKGSSQSPAMLLKLSDLLSYILYESDERLVPLEKELNLLRNYIELEKENRAGKLNISIRDEIETEDLFIAPLILLPLAEYVFEGVEKDQQQLSLKLNMQLKDNHFWFVLRMSGYSGKNEQLLENNIQMEQVQKRLHALYQAKHIFRQEGDEESTTISLSIFLDDTIS